MEKLYLDEEQIKEIVIKYINNSIYNYALMLDGSWGSGKTYFVKETLIPLMEKNERESNVNIKHHLNKNKKGRKVIYISLYGIESCDEISRLIYAELHRSMLKNRRKTSKMIINYAGTFAKLLSDVVKDSKGIDVVEVLKKVFTNCSFENFILIFDDLERCSCNINDVLGYINTFVEQDGIKVILVANENEINMSSHLEYDPLELLVCLQDKIIFNNIKKNDKNTNNQNKTISVTELQNRVNTLFVRNQSYERIKEKLVGQTIIYSPNFYKQVENLINIHVNDEDLNKLLNNKKEVIEKISNYYNHYNLRTFLFFLSKIKELRECLMSYPNIFEQIIDYTYCVCVKIKSGKDLYNWENSISGNRLLFGTHDYKKRALGFEFIDDYVCYGKIDKEEVQNIVKQYLAHEESNKNYKNDPIRLLNAWSTMSDEEVINLVDRMLENLKNDKYEYDDYCQILKYVIDFSSIGFSKDYIDRVVEIMEKKVANSRELLTSRFIIHKDEDTKDIYKEKFNYLNNLIEQNLTDTKQDYFDQALANVQTWGNTIYSFVNEHRNDETAKMQFMNKVNIDKLLDVIDQSNSDNIESFRYALSEMYFFSNIDEYYKDDYQNLYKLYKGLDANNKSYDNIKKQNIKWLKLLIKDKLLLLDKEKFESDKNS